MQNQTPPHSNQDAFNRVWQHFIVEKNPRCVTPNTKTCIYRNETGKNGCAAGIMIPYKFYSTSMEGEPIDVLLKSMQVPNLVDWFKNVSTPLLCDLQKAHDSRLDLTGVEDSLRSVAEKWDITIPLANNDGDSDGA